ncbi:MAG: 2-C-methyl-D-erythritol 4-phosphate cytidylyltransferase [Marmoricola sp.]
MNDAWGLVPTEGRGSLPFALVHGESLIAAAAFGLEAAGVELADDSVPVDRVREAGRPLVLHDPLCPLTPVWFLAEAVELACERALVVAGCRPVTDTVKEYAAVGEAGVRQVLGTVDRDTLVQVTSPLVLPPAVVARLDDWPRGDFATLVDRWRRDWPLLLHEAPATGQRVVVEDDLAVLEALTAPG